MRPWFPMQAVQPGVASMFLATLSFVCMKVFVKMLPHIPVAEIIFFRAAFTFVFSYVVLRARAQNPWGSPATRPWLLLRGLGGAVSLFLYFYLIQRIPLASAYAIQYLAPIFTIIIAFFWLKERVHALQWVFISMAFGGVLMVQGFDMRISLQHLLIGIGATLSMAFTYTIIRRLRGLAHPLTIVFYFSVVTLPIVSLYAPFVWIQPQRWDWLWLLLMACFTQAAQYYSAKAAFEAQRLAKIAAVSYIGIVFALCAGFLFGEHYDLPTYVGMGVVVLSVACSMYLKVRK